MQKCAMRYFTLSPRHEIFGFLGCYSALENSRARMFREPLLVPSSCRLYNPTGLPSRCREPITTHISPYMTTHTFIGRSSFIIQPMKMGPRGLPKLSAPNYFSTLRLTAHETEDFSSEDTIRIISETFAAPINVEGLSIQPGISNRCKYL